MEIKTSFTRASSSNETSKIFRSILSAESEVDKNKEHFWVMGVNCNNSIVYIELSTLGVLDASLVSPRETFRLAIMKGVKSIIVCHNHPSDNVSPSTRDNETTKILKKSGELLGIGLLDHIIISNETFSYFSYAEMGRL